MFGGFMKTYIYVLENFSNYLKTLSVCGFIFLMFAPSCETGTLGLPGDPVTQIEDAINGQKQAITKMNGYNKKELIAHKSEVSALLDKAEPFLRRRANELEKTELLLVLDHLKKSQEGLRLYLAERTKEGKDTTTSEMSRAMSQAQEYIGKAESEFSSFKNKQPRGDD
jgi:hypothetical protein